MVLSASPSFLLFSLLLTHAALLSFSSHCDPNCSTGSCDNNGFCICNLPNNSTILDGDRTFLGGEFCDQNRTMCDGSNTFWCQNGVCNEIVQGENYTCKCSVGYSGQHCELEGVPCGDSYCYHAAECVQTDVLCDCPAEWKGSEDCSMPTLKNSVNNTSFEHVEAGSTDEDKRYVSLSVAAGVILVAVIAILGAKMCRKRSAEGTQFQKLQQVQMRGFIDEDDDAFSHEPLSKAGRA